VSCKWRRRPHRAPRPQVFDTARTTRTLHSGFTPRVDSAQSARIREGRGLGLRDQPTDATTLQLAPHTTADLLLPAGRPSPFPAPCRHLVAILPTDLTSSSHTFLKNFLRLSFLWMAQGGDLIRQTPAYLTQQAACCAQIVSKKVLRDGRRLPPGWTQCPAADTLATSCPSSCPTAC
jgi:hypothetical protein